MTEKPLHTISALAKAAGCTRSNILQRVRRGTIRAVKPGRDWLIPDAEFQRIMREAAIKAREREIGLRKVKYI